MALRLSPLLALLLALVATGSVGATIAPMVPVKITVSGVGTLHAGTAKIGCHVSCSKTLLVKKGTRLAVRAKGPTGARITWAAGCKATATACTLRITKPARIAVTFIPLGAEVNPVPLGHAMVVRTNWRMSVGTVTPNATDQLLTLNKNSPTAQPPAGAQDFLALLNITYIGGGSADVSFGVVGFVETIGVHKSLYDTNTTPCPGSWPDPSLRYAGSVKVFSGQSVSENVCYLIAANDADSLEMFVYGTNDRDKTWFALR